MTLRSKIKKKSSIYPQLTDETIVFYIPFPDTGYIENHHHYRIDSCRNFKKCVFRDQYIEKSILVKKRKQTAHQCQIDPCQFFCQNPSSFFSLHLHLPFKFFCYYITFSFSVQPLSHIIHKKIPLSAVDFSQICDNGIVYLKIQQGGAPCQSCSKT